MNLDNTLIFPAKHFVTTQEKKNRAIGSIQQELEHWLPQIKNPLYAERIKQRVSHDIEMLQEFGHCPGIENYTIHFDGRLPGSKPFCLFDFFPKDFLMIIDESHIAIPQFRGMYGGDISRKKNLIEYGFRLPTAADNRPLKFEEIEQYFNDVIFVSATPGEYELKHSDTMVEQIIRPTGLLDPIIEIHPRQNQMTHLIEEINKAKENGFRSLVMVMTKKLAEQLALFLQEQQIKVCYLHSEMKTPQRTELLQKLRLGIFDCLVGVNLLREGIDLPEVALVAIMDADIESFLRDKRSLIQIMGRAARNTDAKVILFADKQTISMQAAMEESARRRKLQQAYNEKHGIKPVTVKREVVKSIGNIQEAIALASKKKPKKSVKQLTVQQRNDRMADLEIQMKIAAEELNFEKAIALREEWLELKKMIN